MEGVSYSWGEHYFVAEKSRLFRDHQSLQHIMRVPDPRVHEQYGRDPRNFDITVWERQRENIVLAGSYAKFAQPLVMISLLLDTRGR